MKIKTILFSSAVIASVAAQPLLADEPIYINGKWFHNHEVYGDGDLNLPPLTPEELTELLSKSKNMALKAHPTDVINLDVDSDGFIDKDAVFDGTLEQRLYELLLRNCANDLECLDNLPGIPDVGAPAEGTINIGNGDFQSFFLAYWELYYDEKYSYPNGWKDFLTRVHDDFHVYQAALKERELKDVPDSDLLEQITGDHHHSYSPEFIDLKWQEFNGYWENLTWWEYWHHYFDDFKDYWKGKEKLEKFLAKGYSHNHQEDQYDPNDLHHLAEHADDLLELRTVEVTPHPWTKHSWKKFFELSFKYPNRVITWDEDWSRYSHFGDPAIWNKWHLAKMTGSPISIIDDRDDKGDRDDKDKDSKGDNGWHNGQYDDKRHDDWDKEDHKHHGHDDDDDDDDRDDRKGNNGWHNGHYDDKRNDGWDGKDKKGKWGDAETDEDDAKKPKKGKNKKGDD